MAAQWKEILRLATRLNGARDRIAHPPKAGAYPRQNSLAIALRELGALSEPCLLWNGFKVRSCAAGCRWV